MHRIPGCDKLSLTDKTADFTVRGKGDPIMEKLKKAIKRIGEYLEELKENKQN